MSSRIPLALAVRPLPRILFPVMAFVAVPLMSFVPVPVSQMPSFLWMKIQLLRIWLFFAPLEPFEFRTIPTPLGRVFWLGFVPM